MIVDLEDLAEKLRSDDSNQRQEACYLLAKVESPEAADLLAGALSDPDPRVRLLARKSLDRLCLLGIKPDPQLVPKNPQFILTRKPVADGLPPLPAVTPPPGGPPPRPAAGSPAVARAPSSPATPAHRREQPPPASPGPAFSLLPRSGIPKSSTEPPDPGDSSLAPVPPSPSLAPPTPPPAVARATPPAPPPVARATPTPTSPPPTPATPAAPAVARIPTAPIPSASPAIPAPVRAAPAAPSSAPPVVPAAPTVRIPIKAVPVPEEPPPSRPAAPSTAHPGPADAPTLSMSSDAAPEPTPATAPTTEALPPRTREPEPPTAAHPLAPWEASLERGQPEPFTTWFPAQPQKERLEILAAMETRPRKKAWAKSLQGFLAKETDLFVLSKAIKVLGHHHGPGALNVVEPFLDHEDERVISNTLECLSLAGGRSDLERVTQFLDHPVARIRSTAAHSLWMTHPKTVLEVVKQMALSTKVWERDAAKFALQACPTPEGKQLLENLEKTLVQVRKPETPAAPPPSAETQPGDYAAAAPAWLRRLSPLDRILFFPVEVGLEHPIPLWLFICVVIGALVFFFYVALPLVDYVIPPPADS